MEKNDTIKQKLPLGELAAIAVGELIASLIVCAVYLALDRFSCKVPLGALLGSAVTLLNFLALSLMTNRVLDRFMAERGTEEMDEEAATALAAKYRGEVQKQIKLSFIIRNLVMLLTLVAAFLIDVFDVIATLVPLLMLRPSLALFGLIKKKTKGGE